MHGRDPHNLLGTEATIILEDDTHVVLAIRIEKTTLWRNGRLIAALGERAIEGDPEDAEGLPARCKRRIEPRPRSKRTATILTSIILAGVNVGFLIHALPIMCWAIKIQHWLMASLSSFT